MALGLAVGALAIGLWTFDIHIDVPAWMWRIAAIKLLLAGAAGLIAGGAVLLRYVRQAASQTAAAESPLELRAPQWAPTARQRERAPDPATPPERQRTP